MQLPQSVTFAGFYFLFELEFDRKQKKRETLYAAGIFFLLKCRISKPNK